MTTWAQNLASTVTDRPAGSPVYDVRDLLANLGPGGSVGLDRVDQRADSASEVELLENASLRIDSAPLEPDAYIDGIQNSLTIAHRQARPVVLSYVAAGAAVDTGTQVDLGGLVERLTLLSSELDSSWLEEVNSSQPPLPVRLLSAATPPDTEKAISEWVRSERAAVERDLTDRMLDAGASLLVLDGDLTGRAADSRLTAVVKSQRTKYLPDESVLWNLEEGWRSAMFRIPGPVDRFSAYVRLHSNQGKSWTHALVRVETFTPALVDPLAALALTQRQHPTSPDPRWDRHMVMIRACEQLLRDRRPAFF